MKNKNEPRLFYADHNILDAITKGRCHFDLDAFEDDGICLALSYENFEEFHRSGNAARFLGALKNHTPVVLEFDKNGVLYWWRIDLIKFYSEWEHYRHQMTPLRQYFQGLSAKYHGARDTTTFSSYEETFKAWLAQVVRDARLPHGLAVELLDVVTESISDISLSSPDTEAPIDKFRQYFGTDKGQANEIGDIRAIEELWAYLVSKQPELDKQSSLEAFFQLDTNIFDNLTSSQKQFTRLVRGYTMLNWIGYHPDRSLAKKNRLIASSSDGSHVGFASFCERFYTSDKKLALKANALYDYLDIHTQVHLENF